ncbi:hypothetical protein FB451DRAFT_1184931 [Mycena latifolia]|nr:hypothetical protein FB451DRAFT_1184931 [Mycena latifolia]
MRIPFAVFLSLALTLPLLAAPVAHDDINDTMDVAAPTLEQGIAGSLLTGIPGAELALDARNKVSFKKIIKVPTKPKGKPEDKPKYAHKPKLAPKKQSGKPHHKGAYKNPGTKRPGKHTGKPPIKFPAKPGKTHDSGLHADGGAGRG